MVDSTVPCPPKTRQAARSSAIKRFLRVGLFAGLLAGVGYIVGHPGILHVSPEWEAAIVTIGTAVLAAWEKYGRDMTTIKKTEKEGS
jgi:hypothetical protein